MITLHQITKIIIQAAISQQKQGPLAAELAGSFLVTD